MSDAYARRMTTVISQQLVGGTITQAIVSDTEYGEAHFGFEVRLPSGQCKTVWVLCDPEGNGPGFLDIGEG